MPDLNQQQELIKQHILDEARKELQKAKQQIQERLSQAWREQEQLQIAAKEEAHKVAEQASNDANQQAGAFNVAQQKFSEFMQDDATKFDAQQMSSDASDKAELIEQRMSEANAQLKDDDNDESNMRIAEDKFGLSEDKLGDKENEDTVSKKQTEILSSVADGPKPEPSSSSKKDDKEENKEESKQEKDAKSGEKKEAAMKDAAVHAAKAYATGDPQEAAKAMKSLKKAQDADKEQKANKQNSPRPEPSQS